MLREAECEVEAKLGNALQMASARNVILSEADGTLRRAPACGKPQTKRLKGARGKISAVSTLCVGPRQGSALLARLIQ